MAHRTKNSERRHSKVKSVVAGLVLAGTVSLETAAKHLGTSPRTLQRRLNQSGIHFRALVEQSRFEIAGALLCDTDLKVQEIATRLGYSSPGGFSRAFARWAGCSPNAFRAALPKNALWHKRWREMGRRTNAKQSPCKSNSYLPEEK